ncbi:MAG: glucose 1-dehydrogenase [Gammaproteobacteria bacterium]|uniref:SDR family NAD(P)-dependent oxidoreductase n=1 Tax=Pseudomaricurvus alcaniphilus TaxID=1166482 RepID=UPI00140ACC9D|nr:glucose 1-dehydrogenase [Pseudomaricurvus alcaniphilus]MBR9909331.1 glucose 1-dehydrogenase [Gammaproteobacteria bacterium]NHN38267.1 glucose 1-dehydrogenase [Pseudomaricurvus alcaniphilus]
MKPINLNQRLAGKVAIITGGGGGIGSAVARRIVAEGGRVAIADIVLDSATEVAAELGDAALAVQFDAGDPASIEALIERTVEHFGGLDILHNNAAITTPEIQKYDTTAVDIPLEVWKRILDVNLTGYLVGCKYAIPHMIARGGGSIINTASNSGIVGDLGRIGYGTSKAGIINLSKHVATQYGRQGIRCNAIAPGIVLTEATKKSVPHIAESFGKHLALNRMGTPEDIAALVAYLSADESSYITGQCISIEGGSLIHQPHFADYMGDQ